VWFRTLVKIGLLSSASVFAQVTGRFYLEKEVYAPNEPIILHFEAKNETKERIGIRDADPYSFCSGFHLVFTTEPEVKTRSCDLRGFGGSCLSGGALVEPNGVRTQRILLNYDHDVSREGFYQLQVHRQLSYQPIPEPGTYSFEYSQSEHHDVLSFRVDANTRFDQSAYGPWIKQLKSEDYVIRLEAARVLASMAPRYLEDVLLGFADDPELKRFAPLAFKRLKTERAYQAALSLLQKSDVGTYEFIEAGNLLADTGDPKWFEVLAEIGRKQPRNVSYLINAAKTGGERSVPLLQQLLLSDPDQSVQMNATAALGYTGSRNALPLLLELLRTGDDSVADRAIGSLQQLTLRTAGVLRENPQAQYLKWLQWWNREGKTAPVYRSGNCLDLKPLD
jgi:hypothetical protein